MNMTVSKKAIAKRFAQAQESYDEHAYIQKKVYLHLFQLIEQYVQHKTLDVVLDIGCGSGHLSQLLLNGFNVHQLYLNDLYSEIKNHFIAHENTHFLIGDIEELELELFFDLVISSSALQWINNLDAVVEKISKQIKLNHFFCFSTFGTQNLEEIKQLTGQGLDYLNIIELRKILEKHGFEIHYLSEDLEQIYFNHPKDVLMHLKATGVTATANQFRWTKAKLIQFYEDYKAFTIDINDAKKYSLTYHPIYCIAQKVL